jgi:hypothetical protein
MKLKNKKDDNTSYEEGNNFINKEIALSKKITRAIILRKTSRLFVIFNEHKYTQ